MYYYRPFRRSIIIKHHYIVFGICCWISEPEQIQELKRCLESVKDYHVILVNGKWYDVEGDYPLSLLGAQEIIDSYPNVIRLDYAGHHEWESRNLYLEFCNDNDILIVLDTDEWISGSLEGFVPENTPSFPVKGHSIRHGGDVILYRGIRYPNYTRHKDRHNEYWYDNKTKLIFDGKAPENLTINEDQNYRTPEVHKTMKTRGRLKPFR